MVANANLKIKKSSYVSNGLTDRRKIWHGDANWHVDALSSLPVVKCSTFQKSKMAHGCRLNN